MIPILGGGKLLSINMKGTGLSPKQVLQSMECSECCIALNTLEVNGDCWTNSDVQELANNLDLQKLEHLDLECCNSGSGKLTNQGVLFALRDSSNLGYLNLRGHDNCTTHVLRQTFPNAHIIAIQERLECLL